MRWNALLSGSGSSLATLSERRGDALVRMRKSSRASACKEFENRRNIITYRNMQHNLGSLILQHTVHMNTILQNKMEHTWGHLKLCKIHCGQIAFLECLKCRVSVRDERRGIHTWGTHTITTYSIPGEPVAMT